MPAPGRFPEFPEREVVRETSRQSMLTNNRPTSMARSPLFHKFLAGDAFEVAVHDRLALGRRHLDAVENFQRLTNVHSALLGIEGAVGGEDDLVLVVERKSGVGRRYAGERGRVGIEAV